ncbi:MAG: tripartite tricarboxylate transporter substrate binding protein [Burkholderiales bacterium]
MIIVRLILLLGIALSAPVAAQKFPSKPVRMVIATTVGSGPDVIARLLATRLTELWGQQIVVDNRAGASGLIGAELVARAAPDGHTLWMATMTQLISTTLYQRLLMAQEFAPVGMVGSTPYVIAVNAALPVKSIAELIAYVKSRPGQVLYGSAGQGTTPHLCMELFMSMSGTQLMQVPYKGSVPALTDMMGGAVQATCAAAPAMPVFVQSGKVRVLGVTTRAPTGLAPGVAPIADTVPGFELIGWYGVLAPKDTPRALIQRINQDLAKVLAIPDVQEKMIAVGAEAVHTTPDDYGAFLRRETERWAKVLKGAGIKPTP